MLGDGGASTRTTVRIRRSLVALLLTAGGLLPAAPAVHAAPDETSTTAAPPEASTTAVESSTTTTTSSTTTTVPVTAAPTAPPVVTSSPTAPPVVTPNAAPQQVILQATCSVSIVVKQGTRGAEALCVEQTLAALGLRFIGPDDTFGVSTANALKQWQLANGLAADGIVGQATGTRLGIWVASTAPAPPPPTPPLPPPPPPPPPAEALPANSGSGRRVVYSRPAQRVWAVEADGTVVKTHRVSGRLREPYAGTYQVYSRSMYTYSTENPDVKWRYMVRFAYGPGGGRIGFHEIPTKFGVPLQSEAQLGQPLSGGCVRQRTSDAQWMWDWAGVGTKVVVL
jgi:lipoprotein-anchoring transpeptidase ErfK/SrfK